VPGAELLAAADAEAAARGEVSTEDPWAPPKVEKKKKKKKGEESSDEDEDSDDDDDDRDYPEITLSDLDEDEDDEKKAGNDDDGEQPLDESNDGDSKEMKAAAGINGDDDDEDGAAGGEGDDSDDDIAVLETDGEGDELLLRLDNGEGDDSDNDNDNDDDDNEGFISLDGDDTPKKRTIATAKAKSKAVTAPKKSSLKGSKKGSSNGDSKRDGNGDAESKAKPGWGSGWDASSSTSSTTTPALPYAATKFFTPRDIEKIQALRLQNEMAGGSSAANANGKKKRKRFDGTAPTRVEKATGAEVDESDIIGYVPKSRQDKAGLYPPSLSWTHSIANCVCLIVLSCIARLRSVGEGREEERQFRKEGKEKKGGSTNQEKIRKKAFMMTKHAAGRKKSFESFNDAQKKKVGGLL
jgi:hypothetical protein